MKQYQRNIFSTLEQSLKESPAVLIAGARQTGKTTLVQKISDKHHFSYSSFDDLFLQAGADSDPAGFIEQLQKPAILDEVQCAPKIFLPLKRDIDEHRHAGRYLLTGSANPLVIPKLGDSLAGRMQIIKLWPLSQGELMGIHETFVDKLFESATPNFVTDKEHQLPLIDLVLKGGYPDLQNIGTEKGRYQWCNSYLTTLIQKDITDLARIENLHSIPNILQILATRVGSILNERDIARNVGLPLTTLHRYLQLLQHLFLIFFLPGWYRNLGKRIIKSPKIYCTDSAILLHLLGFNRERLLSNLNLYGHAIENFVITEIFKQLTWSQILARPYHYRTHNGSEEVDLVLESTSGRVVGIEIKNSATVTGNDFKGLQKLQEDAAPEFHRGILLYNGKKQLSFGNNLHAIPIQTLWS